MSVEITNPNVTGLVTYTLLINGSAASNLYSIVSIHVHKEVNKIAFAKITLLDGEAASQDFATSNQDDFAPGAEVEIQAGYESDEKTIFKGIITKHGIKAGSNKSSVLVIECRNKAVALTIGRKSKCFHEVKDSEAIEEILGTYALTPTVESTSYTNKELVQYHATDWDFVVARAEANGKIVIVDDDTFTVTMPDAGKTPKLRAAYGDNIFEFEAEMDARFQYSSVKTSSWDSANQEIIEEEGAEVSLKNQGNIPSSDLASVIGLSSFNHLHPGQIPTEEVKAISDAQMLKSGLAKIVGRVKIQGNADIKVGDFITLEGLGNRFNGDGFVSGITHEVVSGNWFSHVQIGLSPTWFYENKEMNHPPASGLLPAIGGLHIGIVVQLQDDPDSEERVLIKVPAIDKDDKGIWARMSRPDAGNERGLFFMPEIDDEVIVGYLNDDPRNPIILGMLHSSAKPAPWKASDDNFEKGIQTKEKLVLLFNDEKKSIELSTPNGNKIVLSDEEGGIHLEDENGNKITLTSEGIMLESASDITLKATGDVIVEGVNVNIKANAEFKAEGGAGAEVSTGAIAVLKGSLVQIN